MKSGRVCYTLGCPKNVNRYCSLTCEERLFLTEHFERNVYCLTVVKDGVKNFSYEKDPTFLAYCEYLDSLKVMEKLEGDKDVVQR